METEARRLESLVRFLGQSAAVRAKAEIRRAYAPAQPLAGAVPLGDDCAAIPDGDGYLLFAAEGILPTFVAGDPWFAGYSAVMVNLSDVAAMGGWPLAVTDVIWSARTDAETIWKGMKAASLAYGVPIVGGHTTELPAGASPCLAAAVLGRATRLITSFDARAGDDLLMAVALRGTYWGNQPFWNASTDAPPERLRADLALLPTLARDTARIAGKDISNGGIVGTLLMLLECSEVGAELWLDRLPQPASVELERWLVSFPSYGYLLSVPTTDTARTMELFARSGVACAVVGHITTGHGLTLGYGETRSTFLPPP